MGAPEQAGDNPVAGAPMNVGRLSEMGFSGVARP